MKAIIACLTVMLVPVGVRAENLATQSPITMQQLMDELRIQGGNFSFTFEKPVFAKVTTTITDYPKGKERKQEFLSDKPSTKIELFFTVSPILVGDYARGDMAAQPRKMKIMLSDCKATAGIRNIYYEDKFIENRYRDGNITGMYDPCVPVHPELNTEYVLHDYFKNGDPYEAKATICFIEKPENASQVKKYIRGEARSWTSTSETK